MPSLFFWLLAAILLLSGATFSYTQSAKERDQHSGEISALMDGLLFYRNTVANYATANPTVTGSIADATLGLPSWYNKPIQLGNYIQAGRSYVFYTGNGAQGLASALYKKTLSINFGTNTGGILYNPASGNTGIPLPPQVPAQSLVILQ